MNETARKTAERIAAKYDAGGFIQVRSTRLVEAIEAEFGPLVEFVERIASGHHHNCNRFVAACTCRKIEAEAVLAKLAGVESRLR